MVAYFLPQIKEIVRDIMKILITGGAGFIGSSIVQQLLAKNFKVVVIDDLSTGTIQNIRPNTLFIHWILIVMIWKTYF